MIDDQITIKLQPVPVFVSSYSGFSTPIEYLYRLWNAITEKAFDYNIRYDWLRCELYLEYIDIQVGVDIRKSAEHRMIVFPFKSDNWDAEARHVASELAKDTIKWIRDNKPTSHPVV